MFRSEYADVPPVDLPIHDAVLARAAEFGDPPALIDGTDGTTLSYEQVDRFHRRVAAALARGRCPQGRRPRPAQPQHHRLPDRLLRGHARGCHRHHRAPAAPPGTVGKLIAGTEMRVVPLDDPGKDLPAGESGEILIRGPQIMKGYPGRPDATTAMIDPDGRLHTGDVGHADDGGTSRSSEAVSGGGWLFVVDRVKELIKYKGFQVAPAEPEALLLTHPGIADAAVIGRYDADGNEVPHAYVVRQPSAGELTEAEIMMYVAERVALYKRIRHVTFIVGVPRAASGRILRRQLRESA
ncbi:acyl-CoA synthetase (AMP-forming)/AMP-acid ligase II [Streptomyces sp. AK010]|nr:acyl-CoA synthetase (AMP-forming)/AMP-acid ligase II [Streptomyces sp. AK010]